MALEICIRLSVNKTSGRILPKPRQNVADLIYLSVRRKKSLEKSYWTFKISVFPSCFIVGFPSLGGGVVDKSAYKSLK